MFKLLDKEFKENLNFVILSRNFNQHKNLKFLVNIKKIQFLLRLAPSSLFSKK